MAWSRGQYWRMSFLGQGWMNIGKNKAVENEQFWWEELPGCAIFECLPPRSIMPRSLARAENREGHDF